MSDRLAGCHDVLLLIAEKLMPKWQPYLREEDDFSMPHTVTASYRDILSFSRTSKAFLAAASEVLYRKIRLPPMNEDAHWLLLRTLDTGDSQLASRVTSLHWTHTAPRLLLHILEACPNIAELHANSLEFLEYTQRGFLPLLRKIRLTGSGRRMLFSQKMGHFLSRAAHAAFHDLYMDWSGRPAFPATGLVADDKILEFRDCFVSETLMTGMLSQWQGLVTCISLAGTDTHRSMREQSSDKRSWHHSLLHLFKDSVQVLKLLDSGRSLRQGPWLLSGLSKLENLDIRASWPFPSPDSLPASLKFLSVICRKSEPESLRTLLRALQDRFFLPKLAQFPDIRIAHTDAWSSQRDYDDWKWNGSSYQQEAQRAEIVLQDRDSSNALSRHRLGTRMYGS